MRPQSQCWSLWDYLLPGVSEGQETRQPQSCGTGKFNPWGRAWMSLGPTRFDLKRGRPWTWPSSCFRAFLLLHSPYLQQVGTGKNQFSQISPVESPCPILTTPHSSPLPSPCCPQRTCAHLLEVWVWLWSTSHEDPHIQASRWLKLQTQRYPFPGFWSALFPHHCLLARWSLRYLQTTVFSLTSLCPLLTTAPLGFSHSLLSQIQHHHSLSAKQASGACWGLQKKKKKEGAAAFPKPFLWHCKC